MLQFTVIGWIIFRSNNLQSVKLFIFRIINNTNLSDFKKIYIENEMILILISIFIIYNLMRIKFDFKKNIISQKFNPLAMTIVIIGLFIAMILNPSDSSQFIYFKF